MSRKQRESPMMRAIKLNNKRRVVRAKESRKAAAKWMIECQDLWDSEDDDCGVYFVDCGSEAAVTRKIRSMDSSSDRVLGIYDLSQPLDKQGPGLTREEWKARRSPKRG